jgi:hypothetical protein
MEKKINLERIINNHIDTSKMNKYDKQAIVNGFKQFGEQLLELAAENADLNIGNTYLGNTKYVDSQKQNYISIDKQSILNTINQIN